MAGDPQPEDIGPFQFAVLTLSLALLVGLAAEVVFPLPEEVRRLVFFVDTTVCGILFIDFVVRFRAAPSKLGFMKWGWIDLLASVPTVEFLRFGRVFRIVRILRVIVAMRSLRRFMQVLAASKAQTGAAAAVVIAFIVVSFGSAGVLLLEQGADGNINTAEDALWWSMATVTTVGYGDHYPVTTGGRVIASMLMVCGIGLFGTLSGLAAHVFLGGRRAAGSDADKTQQLLLERLEALQADVARLRETSPSGHNEKSSPEPPGTGDST